MKRVICLALVAVLLMMTMVACSSKSDEELIRDRIVKYFDCANNGDYNGLLGCLNSTGRAGLESMMNLLGDYAGMNLNDLLNVGSLFGGSDLYSMRVDSVDNILVNGDKATAKVTMSATVNGQTQTVSDNMELVKEDGDWFVSLNLGSLF